MDETEQQDWERERGLRELFEEGVLTRGELEAELARLRNPELKAADDEPPGLLARLLLLPLGGAKQTA